MRRGWGLLLMSVMLVATACGDDDAGGATASTGATTTTTAGTSTTGAGATTTSTTLAPTTGGGCEVQVSGDMTTSWTGPDNISGFTTDYWYTNEELKQQFDFFGDPSKGTFDEVMAAGGQVFTLFLFNCSGPNGELVSLSVSANATRADFPMSAGTYAIRGGLFSDEMGPTDFSVLFSVNSTDVWGVDGDGTLTLSEWDGQHATGTFQFAVKESFVTTNPRSLAVTGAFEVTCQASVQC